VLVGLASPLSAALLEGMEADVGDLESHLDLLYFMSRPAYIVGLVERVNNYKFGLKILQIENEVQLQDFWDLYKVKGIHCNSSNSLGCEYRRVQWTS
jgi:hypothetical protein